ncbi:MAG TPA: SMC family ATPase [Euzebya sp.]|nr:SMC family ATPase [Euzebya sp.]
MQPRELIISGLTSFSDRVVLDFSDVSLFALVGPTGAGKSSVIDAMTLALYGRVPRLHANEIAPAIATTATECTVGLTFTVRRRPYRAVRTIRRTSTGASTVEAALEQLDDSDRVVTTLAGTADDVTTEVERLIGLSFEEFTRAVVLPQGEFARVLRAKASERQSLLARLLGTGIYDRVKQRAGSHARAAQDRAEQTAHQVAQLGDVTEDEVVTLQARVGLLDDLLQRLQADTEALADVRDRYRDAATQAKSARDRADRLQAIAAPPPDVVDLADRIAQAEEGLLKLQRAAADAEAQVQGAEDAAGDPALLDQLNAVLAAHGRTPELTQALADAEQTIPPLQTVIQTLQARVATGEEQVVQATSAQVRIHREHAALQAVEGLEPGSPCPVCATTLTTDAPALQKDPTEGLGAVTAAAEALNRAVGQVATARTQLDRAHQDLRDATGARDRAAERLQVHLADLDGQPTANAATVQLDTARQHSTALAGLRREAREAREDLQRATLVRRQLGEQSAALGQRLDRLRLAVAELNPPALDGEVATDWSALHDWAQVTLPAAALAATDADRAVALIQDEGTALRTRMEQACADAQVPAGDGDPRDRTVQARADAAAQVQRLQQVLAMMADLRAEEADARQQAAVGGELARLLRADQFQKWLLDEATRALVAGASAQLHQLSNGRYQLTLDGRGAIQVADLASAGMTRSVRTLSGGETFLASLALALSLADQIALSAAGPVALESLFIDEGFGALDPETLDVAAGAIEQLGAGERTVGVITHVADIADRMPTRFVVHRGASGSRVERVDA